MHTDFIAFQLTNCKRLRDAIRNEMFPTDEMIASLGREFGIPLTTEDLEGSFFSLLIYIAFHCVDVIQPIYYISKTK